MMKFLSGKGKSTMILPVPKAVNTLKQESWPVTHYNSGNTYPCIYWWHGWFFALKKYRQRQKENVIISIEFVLFTASYYCLNSLVLKALAFYHLCFQDWFSWIIFHLKYMSQRFILENFLFSDTAQLLSHTISLSFLNLPPPVLIFLMHFRVLPWKNSGKLLPLINPEWFF